MLKHRALTALLLGVLGFSVADKAEAALYEANPANFGTALATVSNCDDCFEGPIALPGGQSIDFFGATYTGLFVGSNGYVTFGSGQSGFSGEPLDVQTLGPMIAGYFTDLDTRNDATSQVFVNSATTGQLIITFAGIGHFSQNYAVRSTFQLIVRSTQFVVPGGEGTVGFCYDAVTDGALGSAGFGDGLATSNPGEQAIYSGVGTGLNNAPCRWFTIGAGGIPGGAGPTLTPPGATTVTVGGGSAGQQRTGQIQFSAAGGDAGQSTPLTCSVTSGTVTIVSGGGQTVNTGSQPAPVVVGVTLTGTAQPNAGVVTCNGTAFTISAPAGSTFVPPAVIPASSLWSLLSLLSLFAVFGGMALAVRRNG